MAYSTRADIESIFGTTNVAVWADLNNNQSAVEITAQIATAIAMADSDIDRELRSSIYVVPFDPVPDDIKVVSSMLAGVWLYENRGVNDVDAETGRPLHKLARMEKRAKGILKAIKQGVVYLDSTIDATATPEAIQEEDDA